MAKEITEEIIEEIKMHCSKCHKYFNEKEETCPNCHSKLIKTNFTWKLLDHCYFMKISSLKVIQNLRRGIIWFRPPQYYRSYYENGTKVIQDDSEFIVNIDKNNIKYDPDQQEKVIFCMYKLITDKEGNYIISEKDKELLKKFGNKISVINSIRMIKFLKRNVNYLSNDIRGDHVMYYTELMQGDINPFYKKIDYHYQNEYRLILKDKKFCNYYNTNGDLVNNRFEYKNRYNLKKIFSKPIDINIILDGKNEKDWINEAKLY